MRKLLSVLMCTVLLVGQLHAQSRKLSGKVTDAKDGAPMSGVTVLTQDGKTGSKTGQDGSYNISVSSSAKALVFSYIGFSPVTQPIGTSLTMDVQLKAEEANLAEVVVTTFGIKRDRKTLGYSTPTISADAVTATRNSNVSNSFVGKVAGV